MKTNSHTCVIESPNKISFGHARCIFVFDPGMIEIYVKRVEFVVIYAWLWYIHDKQCQCYSIRRAIIDRILKTPLLLKGCASVFCASLTLQFEPMLNCLG